MCGDRTRECGKAARDEGCVAAIGLHRGDQGLASASVGDAFGQYLGNDGGGQVAQEFDTLDQRCFEIQLSVHRAGGDCGYLCPLACHIGQLVNAFLPDHGAVHIGEQHLLSPSGAGLDHEIKP